jgi:trimeric autotransporter adhesin
MKSFLLSLVAIFLLSLDTNAQCTISGASPVSGTYSGSICSTFSSCSVIYIGDGVNPTNFLMTANLDFSCLGAIQFIVRNNANLDFSSNNYNLDFAAGSSISVEAGGNISAGTNCSASDLIRIGGVKIASCNGGGGALTDFPGLVSGGYNVVNASATSVCGSGTSTITATMNPAPTTSTTYRWYTVASGGTPFLTSNATSNPYTATYTTGTLSANTTYYIEATRGSIVTPRRAVVVTVNPIPATPTVNITQPTCSVATGTIAITNPSGSGYTYSINGSTYTNTTGVFSSVTVGTYSVTAKSLGCISSAASITVNPQPTTPAQPTLGSLLHPTCSTVNGSFTITNYNAAYNYAASPSTGVTFSGATVNVLSGNYTITATLGACTSIASSNVTINAQPTNTWSASGWSTGAPPTSAQRIVFAHDFSSSADLTGCSCQVTSGAVVINSGHTLSLVNQVNVNAGGSLTFEDGASLVQINDASVNTGDITYKRKTTPLKRYDYTYWSSPVVAATLSQLATNSLLYSFSPTTNNWVYQTGGATMAQGVGYIGRAPNNLTYGPTEIVETSFVGVPGNGVITTPIIKSTGAYSLIGNPYPSAIDADLFIMANTASTNGTVYFWTHNTAITNLQYTANDYAKYNLTGSVRTATSAISGGALPTGKIAAGQGFFIEAKTSLANGTYSATFNNSMRISGNNDQFFKSNQPTSTSLSEQLERHRIWLSLNNPLGAYSQMLLGYIEGATNDFDSLFDGKTMPSGNSVSIYTMVGDDDLAIQGKSLPLSDTDIIPLGYNTTINGELTISLEDFDGVFSNQNVYLLDKVNNSLNDLKTAPYTFVTAAGTIENRFELRFDAQALGTTPIIDDNDIKIISADHQLQVISPAITIAKVEVYDILGKLLFSQNNLNTNLFQTTSLNVTPQILLVKVTLDNQRSITRKTVVR